MKVDVRVATSGDLTRIRELDAVCFPSGDPDSEPTAPGELERGLSDGQLSVATVDTRIVGFLQYAVTSDGLQPLVFVSAVGVDPVARRQGVARTLLEVLLAQSSNSHRIATTTSPTNIAMAALLCALNFVGVDYIEDYFGPGRDRLYFEWSPLDSYGRRVDAVLVPTAAQLSLRQLLARPDRTLYSVVDLPHGWHFAISATSGTDDSTLMTNEVSVSGSFAGTILASLTFLFGFGASSDPRTPETLLAALAVSIVVSTFALVGYANASGELSRIRTGAFSRYMVYANLTSEFGGVYPLLLLTGAIFMATRAGTVSGAVVAMTSSAMIYLYHRSGLSLICRYQRSHRWAWKAYEASLTALPFAAFGLLHVFDASVAWTSAVGVLLVGGLLVCLKKAQER